MNLIIAVDSNWAIGYEGNLLCHIPGDLKFFKEKTTESTVVMGRATLESLPGKKGLPNRNNIVLTRNPDYQAERASVVHSIEELNQTLEKVEGPVFVIGGESIYKSLLPQCDTCYVTKILESFPADRYFINLDQQGDFQLTYQSEIMEENGHKYRFCTYERK